MKNKLISKTYLKDVNKYKLNIFFNQNEFYLSVKKIIEIKKPFILPTAECLIDNGYYIVEVIPKNENYAMRVFFNEKKERLMYYFDITLGNGLDLDTLIPYYNDLYLDIIVVNKKIKILDENELQEALDNKVISINEFTLANQTKDVLIDSITKNNNKYVNLNLESYLE